MPKLIARTRIIKIPQSKSLQGGRLDSIRLESVGRRRDLVMDFQGFIPSVPSLLLMEQESLYERLEGHFIPRRLRFMGITNLNQIGLFKNLDSLPLTHEARAIRDMFAWRPIGQKNIFFLLIHSGPEDTDLRFFADRILSEPRTGKSEPITFLRDWSSPPAMPARLVPDTPGLYRQFGGDPVSVRVNGKVQHRNLFIGGIEKQSATRPDVGAVLNLGEEPSRWLEAKPLDPRDRWVNKGEGRDGMSIAEITEEALWVIKHLNAGERVLVHCVAEMNRSSTICCAVVMLLEGLSAKAALERVRKRHPWARPDTHHWLSLRWLASTIKRN
jgi:hypothetical protein